jgi:hypothetical protein
LRRMQKGQFLERNQLFLSDLWCEMIRNFPNLPYKWCNTTEYPVPHVCRTKPSVSAKFI